MRRTAACLPLLACLAAPATAGEVAALAAEGRTLIQGFAKSLKGELTAAIDEGGPVNAIGVCHTRAPEIAEAASIGGWTVARSSHRLRNPDNAPDAWTEAAIEDFLASQAEGTPAADLARTEIVGEDGARVFRMAKAIPTAEVCLACHGGEKVTAEVEEKLAELYPQDRARGFETGEMRGVFTLKKPLD